MCERILVNLLKQFFLKHLNYIFDYWQKSVWMKKIYFNIYEKNQLLLKSIRKKKKDKFEWNK